MRKFLLLAISFLVFQGAFAQCDNLFFSEYLEGSSNNKALELYNPTSGPIDLGGYVIHRFNNGGSASPSGVFSPVGILAPGDVFVIANSNADTTILNVSDTTSSITFYNGDDALILLDTLTGDTLDAIGIVGVDPGTNWPVGTGATSEFTLIRMIGINQGEKDWTLGAAQWDVFPQNMADSLGAHSMTPCPSGPNCTEDLFFSEYIEGSSSNKAMEIYNPTNAIVDLTDYVVYRYNNGSPNPTDSLFPQGMLASDEVFVFANPSANPAILAQADTSHTLTFYNGDDAIALINRVTGDTLDIIGEIGVDPGSGWTVGTGATNNFTLIRMPSIQKGETNWAVGVTQWNVFSIDMADSLGAHTMFPCVTVPVPTFSFFGSATNVDESVGSVTVQVDLVDADTATTDTIEVVLNVTGTATNGSDFSFTFPPVSLIFPAGSSTGSQSVTVTITDDAVVEGIETIILDLQNPSAGTQIVGGSYTLNIIDNDFALYPIGTISAVDTNGVVDSIGVTCKIGGLVYGTNLRPGGLQFTIIDGTGGIAVFNNSGSLGYSVAEGDSIFIIGTVSQFNGLAQFAPDSIEFVSAGNMLKQSTAVTALGENTESDLVRLDCFTIVDTADWGGGFSGFNVDVTNGTDTLQVRIDADVDLFTLPVPSGLLSITGTGGQFDPSSPYFDGYQLLPRYSGDIVEVLPVAAAFTVGNPSFSVYQFTDASVNATSWSWDFGDGNTSTQQNPSNDYADSNGTYTVTLIVSNACFSDTSTQVINVLLGMEGEMDRFGGFTAFPNPVQDQLKVQFEAAETGAIQLSLTDLSGKSVLKEEETALQGFNSLDLDLSGVPAGFYLLHAEMGNKRAAIKLIVE